jgi:hypothetical protein
MSDCSKLREVHDTAIVDITSDFNPLLHASSKECVWNVVIIDIHGGLANKNVINVP